MIVFAPGDNLVQIIYVIQSRVRSHWHLRCDHIDCSCWFVWIAVSCTFLRKTSISSVCGLKKYWFYQWRRFLRKVSGKFSEEGLQPMLSYHSLARWLRVSLKFLIFISSDISGLEAAIQSFALIMWVSGLSPFSPLKMGGYLFYQLCPPHSVLLALPFS